MTIKQKLTLLHAVLVALEDIDNPVIDACFALQEQLEIHLSRSPYSFPLDDRSVVKAASALILDPASWGASSDMCESLGKPGTHPVVSV